MHNLFGLPIQLLGICCIGVFAQVYKSVCVGVLGLMVNGLYIHFSVGLYIHFSVCAFQDVCVSTLCFKYLHNIVLVDSQKSYQCFPLEVGLMEEGGNVL